MFFCPGSIGLLNDDDGSDWGDIDNFYNHPSSYHTFQHHTGDHDNKFSKMGSLMFVVDVCLFIYLFIYLFLFPVRFCVLTDLLEQTLSSVVANPSRKTTNKISLFFFFSSFGS
jgi:hypothetical protein